MAELEDLPDEILLSIMSRLHRSVELGSISFACRRLNHLAAPFLNDCRLFRHLDVWFGRTVEDGFLSDASKVSLRSILKRPELCLYVLHAQIDFDLDPWATNYDLPLNCILSFSEGTQILDRAVKDLGIREWEDGNELLDDLNWAFNCRVAVFLLILSNLEKLDLQLCGNPGDDFWIRWTILKVVSSHPPRPMGSSRLSFGFLALREVSLQRLGYYGIYFSELTTFLLLPSIQKISAGTVVQNWGFKWGGEYGVSTVKELSFRVSSMCVDALEEFLRIPKALRHFRYECEGEVANDDGQESYVSFDNCNIRQAVRRAQRDLEDANIEVVNV